MPLPLAALLPIVTAYAPTLIRHLAGPRAGDVAEHVSTAVAAVTGTQDPDEARAILADPNKAADLALELARIDLEQERLANEDRQRASRQMTTLAQAGHPMAWMPAIWALMTAAGFFAVLAGLFFLDSDFPPGVRELLLMVVGVLLREYAGSGQYWTGSSSGSARKDERLSGMGNGR